uniref:Uncharacterized protein n=1 Tax=viral metagenome TaxID=1070528 RepID=A0A6C0EGX1_9ZZZZ
MYEEINSNQIQTFVNDNNEIESQGIVPFQQQGGEGTLLSFAVPAGLFVLNQLYQPNKTAEKCLIDKKDKIIEDDNFEVFFKNSGFEKIEKTRKRRKNNTNKPRNSRKNRKTKK